MRPLPPLLALCLCFAAPARAAEPNTKVAMVLLSQAKLPAGAEVVRAFATYAAKGESVRVVPASKKPAHADAILQLDLGKERTAFVALMPAPIPKGEAEEYVRYSISSYGKGWKLPAHKAHLVVALTGRNNPGTVEALSTFTALLAAVVQTSPAVGIYWGQASATHEPKFFLTMAKDSLQARLMIWNGVSAEKEKDGRVSLLSHGMDQLGLPDLLLVSPKTKAPDALMTLFEFLSVIAYEGKPIPEGDTVGRSAEERLQVHYVPSPIDAGKKVWRVELP